MPTTSAKLASSFVRIVRRRLKQDLLVTPIAVFSAWSAAICRRLLCLEGRYGNKTRENAEGEGRIV
jgi:hypothetical protein